MKYTLIALLIFASGCSSRTDYGKCIGLNGKEDPKLQYNYSAWNIGMGLFFSGLILPPLFVALDELKCPVGNK